MKRNRQKYAARNKRARISRAAYLFGRLCQCCQHSAAVEVHHIAGRNAAARDAIAADYESPGNWLAVCRACHEKVDKESPALWACAAKLLAGELDIELLRRLRPGRRFSFNLSELQQAADDMEAWRNGKSKRNRKTP